MSSWDKSLRLLAVKRRRSTPFHERCGKTSFADWEIAFGRVDTASDPVGASEGWDTGESFSALSSFDDK
jgi:hypothetical protein